VCDPGGRGGSKGRSGCVTLGGGGGEELFLAESVGLEVRD
jgi:hypothetical protein